MMRSTTLPTLLCAIGLLAASGAWAQDVSKVAGDGRLGDMSAGNGCKVEDGTALAKRRALGPETLTRMQVGDLSITLYPRQSTDEVTDGELPQEYIVIERGDTCLDAIVDGNAFIVWARPAMPDGYSVAEPAPLAILSSYSGGAHCCTTLYAIFPGPAFKMQELAIGNSEPTLSQEWVGSPPRLTFGDDSFAYWNTSFAGSPGGAVILDWAPEGYHLSDSMYKETPDQATLDKLAADMRTAVLAFGGPYVPMTATERPQTKGELDSVIWSDLLDLVYSGHADLAAALFDKGWPAEVKGKRDFWRDFVEQMQATWIWTPWELSKVLDPEVTFAGK